MTAPGQRPTSLTRGFADWADRQFVALLRWPGQVAQQIDDAGLSAMRHVTLGMDGLGGPTRTSVHRRRALLSARQAPVVASGQEQPGLVEAEAGFHQGVLLRLVRDSASREQEGTELSVQGSLERPSDPLELAALGHWQQAFMGIPGAESPLWTDELRDQALRLELKGTTPETLAREVLARVVTEAPKELAGCIGELLQADDPELRLVALAATADLPADEQRPLLELGVVDHEAQVRRATAMCLTQVEQRWAVSLLRELSRDEDLAVRRTAVDGMAAVLPALTRQLMASPLGGIEQPRRVSSLLRQIRRQDEDVQTEGDDEAEGNDEAEVWPSAEGRLCLVPSAVLPDEEMTELETDQAAEHSVPESDEPSSNGPKKPEGLAAE